MWCAACGGQYDWRNPNRILVIQGSTDHQEAKIVRAHAAPHGMCDNLVNTLKLLANQQTGGVSPAQVLVDGFPKNEVGSNNHEAVTLGDLEKTQESLLVVKAKFTADFPEVVLREGADELTLGREEEGMLRTFIDTANVGDSREATGRG